MDATAMASFQAAQERVSSGNGDIKSLGDMIMGLKITMDQGLNRIHNVEQQLQTIKNETSATVAASKNELVAEIDNRTLNDFWSRQEEYNVRQQISFIDEPRETNNGKTGAESNNKTIAKKRIDELIGGFKEQVNFEDIWIVHVIRFKQPGNNSSRRGVTGNEFDTLKVFFISDHVVGLIANCGRINKIDGFRVGQTITQSKMFRISKQVVESMNNNPNYNAKWKVRNYRPTFDGFKQGVEGEQRRYQRPPANFIPDPMYFLNAYRKPQQAQIRSSVPVFTNSNFNPQQQQPAVTQPSQQQFMNGAPHIPLNSGQIPQQHVPQHQQPLDGSVVVINGYPSQFTGQPQNTNFTNPPVFNNIPSAPGNQFMAPPPQHPSAPPPQHPGGNQAFNQVAPPTTMSSSTPFTNLSNIPPTHMTAGEYGAAINRQQHSGSMFQYSNDNINFSPSLTQSPTPTIIPPTPPTPNTKKKKKFNNKHISFSIAGQDKEVSPKTKSPTSQNKTNNDNKRPRTPGSSEKKAAKISKNDGGDENLEDTETENENEGDLESTGDRNDLTSVENFEHISLMMNHAKWNTSLKRMTLVGLESDEAKDYMKPVQIEIMNKIDEKVKLHGSKKTKNKARSIKLNIELEKDVQILPFLERGTLSPIASSGLPPLTNLVMSTIRGHHAKGMLLDLKDTSYDLREIFLGNQEPKEFKMYVSRRSQGVAREYGKCPKEFQNQGSSQPKTTK